MATGPGTWLTDWFFVGIMIVIGLGMGYATTPTMVLVESAVGWQMPGAATASNTFTRSIGQTIGLLSLEPFLTTHSLLMEKNIHGRRWQY